MRIGERTTHIMSGTVRMRTICTIHSMYPPAITQPATMRRPAIRAMHRTPTAGRGTAAQAHGRPVIARRLIEHPVMRRAATGAVAEPVATVTRPAVTPRAIMAATWIPENAI
jgi:hypothetical protein